MDDAMTTKPNILRHALALIMLLLMGTFTVSTAVLPVQYAYANESGDSENPEANSDESDSSSSSSNSSSSSSSSSSAAQSASFSSIGGAACRFWQNTLVDGTLVEDDGSGDSDSGASPIKTILRGIWTTFFGSKTSSGEGESADNEASHSYEEIVDKWGWLGAGTFLCYQDSAFDTASSLVGLVVGNSSNSSQAVSYQALKNDDALSSYAHYGRALSLLGLDSNMTDATGIGQLLWRFVLGGIMLIAYAACNLLSMLFSAAFNILSMLNPFSYFGSSWDATAAINTSGFVGSTSGSIGGSSGIFASVSGLIKSIYEPLHNMGILACTLVFIVGLALAIMALANKNPSARKRTAWGVTKDWVKRLAFILVLFPVCGIAYTAALDTAKEVPTAFTAANNVVQGTFVDFGTWVSTKHLALPEGVELVIQNGDSTGGDLDMSATTPARTAAKKINKFIGYSADSSEKSMQLIEGFISGAHVTAASFESDWKNQNLMPSNKMSQEDAEHLVESTQVDSWSKQGDELAGYSWFTTSSKTSPSTGKSGYNYNHSNTAGGLSAMSTYAYLMSQFTDTQVVMYSADDISSNVVMPEHVAVNAVGNNLLQQVLVVVNSTVILLAVAILSFVFAWGMVVSMVGRGIKMITSVPFAVLGSFKAMAKVVTIAAIMVVEVIGTIFVWLLCVEIFLDVNSVFESWIRDQGVESVGDLTTTLSSASNMIGLPNGVLGDLMQGASASLFAQAVAIVFLVISIIFNGWLVLKMIKLRKSILKTIDEFAASIVDRFFTPSQHDRGPNSALPGSSTSALGGGQGKLGAAAKKAGGAALSGAGLAAGTALGHGAIGAANDAISDAVGAGEEAAQDIVGDDGSENQTVSSENDVRGIEGAALQALPDGTPTAEAVGDGGDGAVGANGADGADGDGDGADGTDASPNADDTPGANLIGSGSDGTPGTGGLVATAKSDNKNVSASSDMEQEEADNLVSDAMGETTALQDENINEARREAVAQQAAETVGGVVQFGKGAAETAASVASGNPVGAVEGVSDMAQGAKGVSDASKKAQATNAQITHAQHNGSTPNAQGTGNGGGNGGGGVENATAQNASSSNKSLGPQNAANKTSNAQQVSSNGGSQSTYGFTTQQFDQFLQNQSQSLRNQGQFLQNQQDAIRANMAFNSPKATAQRAQAQSFATGKQFDVRGAAKVAAQTVQKMKKKS